MKKFHPIMIFFLVVPVAGILAISAFQHIDNSFLFLSTVYSYDLVSMNVGLFFASFLPFFQLSLSLVLLFEHTYRRAAFGLCSLLFFAFAVAQLTALIRGLNISCGCFGSTNENPIGAGSIFLATSGMAVSIIGWYFSRPQRSNTEGAS